MTFQQDRAGDSGEELAQEQEPVEAGLDLAVEAAGAVVEAGLVADAVEDSAAGGNREGAPLPLNRYRFGNFFPSKDCLLRNLYLSVKRDYGLLVGICRI